METDVGSNRAAPSVKAATEWHGKFVYALVFLISVLSNGAKS